MTKKLNEQQSYSEQQIAQRRDDAIRRALNTPPKPYKDARIGQSKPVRKPTAAKK